MVDFGLYHGRFTRQSLRHETTYAPWKSESKGQKQLSAGYGKWEEED